MRRKIHESMRLFLDKKNCLKWNSVCSLPVRQRTWWCVTQRDDTCGDKIHTNTHTHTTISLYRSLTIFLFYFSLCVQHLLEAPSRCLHVSLVSLSYKIPTMHSLVDFHIHIHTHIYNIYMYPPLHVLFPP